MPHSTQSASTFFSVACYFEAALTLAAIALGWLVDIDPFDKLAWDERALLHGLLLTLPLLLLFFALQEAPPRALRRIKALLLETLGPRLYRHHWTDLMILATIAGFSEEVLFRGTLQPWLENSLGMTAGLWLSNAAFALAHAVTPLYALLALLMGLYLGISLDYGGERNLLTPIVIHGFYDFIAFLVILRNYRNSL
ncbi:CPBP family intramembrane metalloprotease [Methylomonas sp. SURF-2]|uniref:CPBP family intramembrane metalloprotease n=1 Tax=Methylomonas subterranea TaxID=2952225 RepID=A0ABT1TFQ6_9GAMM|nr:CPBP family intramembrane glutamic endopeptidase [Methylomonas sp. SURF-2]MCQ8104305.1 CPBP family intramembrane metalloprotease [Methylomonas sp. SURF-2]